MAKLRRSQSGGLLELLINDAKEQARAAAESQGYFGANVSAVLDESAKPPTVRIHVEPGEPTRVSEVSIEATGPATEAAGEAATVADMRAGWLLPPGAVFRQADWAAAKTAAVRALAAKRYAAARLVSSKADIDPETRTARLSVTIDSGPPFRFGPLEISGLEKYSEATVRNLTTFATGDSYSEETLKEFVRRLNATGYFASVQATIAPDPEYADSAPVRVMLIEAPTKKISGGIGFATDVLYIGQVSFVDNVNLDGHGLQFRSDLRVDSKEQDGMRFTLAERRNTPTQFSATLGHTDIENLTTRDVNAGWVRQTSDPRNQTSYSLYYYLSHQSPPQGVIDLSHALYGEVGHVWRRR